MLNNKNEFINEFMGPEFDLDYTSWDTLMLVLDKIETYNVSYCIFVGKTREYQCNIVHFDECDKSDKNILHTGDNKFNVTYSAIIEFIEWSNERKQ